MWVCTKLEAGVVKNSESAWRQFYRQVARSHRLPRHFILCKEAGDTFELTAATWTVAQAWFKVTQNFDTALDIANWQARVS